MRNERHPTAASDATGVHKHELGAYGHGGESHHAYIGGPRDVLADSRAPFCEYAMRGRPEGASHSACVSKRQADICGYCGRIYSANLGGPGGEYCLLEVPICECAMRGSLALHYAWITSPCIKQASLSTAMVSNREPSMCRREIAFSEA